MTHLGIFRKAHADRNPVGWIRRHPRRPAIHAPLGRPLTPISNLRVGDAPHMAPGVRTYMTGWNDNDPIREQTARVYAPQPYPPGVFPVGVDPNDPSITHF